MKYSAKEAVVSYSVLLKQPSAFVPLLMSLIALSLVGIAVAVHGVHGVRQPDEGAFAHLWQLMMAGQLPFIAWFALQWLPRSPRDAVPVLVLQAIAGIAAAAPVFLLGL